MRLVEQRRIERQTGTALRLAHGQTLRIIDPEGEQVADVTVFSAEDPDERFAAGTTIDFAATILLTTGHALHSNRGRVIMTIVNDTCGRHDLLLAPCSPETFRVQHGVEGYHPSCLDNLAKNLEPFGIGRDAITDTLNVFMNVPVSPSGEVSVETPASRAGDHLDLRAEIDLIVGITACSSEATNNGALKPIDIEVYEV